jgi:DNA polymerase (family 10)
MVDMLQKVHTAPGKLRAPLRNNEIADRFDDIATMLELGGANPFRVRAYRNAARFLRRYGREVAEAIAAGEDLSELPGIGEDLAGKIRDLAETGSTALLKSLKSKTPAIALELMRIPGLGPRRIRTLNRKLGLHTLAQLHQAALHGRVRLLPGFGKKLEQYLLQALEAQSTAGKRTKLAVATAAAQPLLAYLQNAPGVSDVVIAGSYRRGQDTVGDLDFLVTATPASGVIDAFKTYPEFARIQAAGTTRATGFLRSGLQVDLRVLAPESFGSALHYFTGSKAHNIAIRALGRKAGLTINEYGVFRGRRRLGGKTEKEVFAAVGLPYIEPELRENRGEIEAAANGMLPHLVTYSDLKGDLHGHSLYTDGTATIREMALAARRRGFSYIAITDHSRRMTITRGLDTARLRRQSAEIDRVNAALSGIFVLKGIEVDIRTDGALDLPDHVLAELDVVVAAVHSSFHLGREAQTTRIEKALANPLVTILAHPTGRMLESREPYEVDMPRLIRAAAAGGVALELNAQPERLDLSDVYCHMAKDAGLLISIASDAHAPEDYEQLRHGVAQARRGWLTPNDVLNTMSLGDLRGHLRRRRHT